MRVFMWIQSQLKYFKYSEVSGLGLDIDSCGICIDEFANSDETKDE